MLAVATYIARAETTLVVDGTALGKRDDRSEHRFELSKGSLEDGKRKC
jgi:hypothetical protein